MRNWREMMLWAIFVATLCGLLFCHLVGCVNGETVIPETVSAEACWDAIAAEIQKARDCKSGVAAIARLVHDKPICAGIIGDAGLSLVCHEEEAGHAD